MKVTVLTEDSRPSDGSDLVAESGLSLHIEYDDRRILFDTGMTGAFAQNAERLGIDIREVDLAIISHHHFDHGGGLARFLEVNSKAPVIMRRRGSGEHTFSVFGIINRYVGLDHRLFEEVPSRFQFVDESVEVSPGIFILTELEEKYPRPKGNRWLFVKEGGPRSPDTFEHELILAIREKGELVVITGCSHRGILNMVDTVAQRFQGIPIRALFGGFHLIGLPMLNTMAGSKREVEDIARTLRKYDIGRIYTGHCTGPKGYRVLKGVLGDQLELLQTGSRVEV